MMLESTRIRATNLYFDIEKHFALGNPTISFRDINRMLGLSSSASSQYYVKILIKWGLIERTPNTMRTLQLTKRNYPPVEYRKGI